MLAGLRGREEPVGQIVERLGGDLVERDPPCLRPARELPPRAVELAVGGENPQRSGLAARRRGDQADEEIVGARREHDRVGHAAAKLASDIRLGLGPDLIEDFVPLGVGQAGGVVPRLDLAVEAGVGPQMMAVRGEVQALRICGQTPAEQPLETQRSVLSAHSSGNTRLSRVERR